MSEHPTLRTFRKVKVYVLKDDGKWEDRATGTVRYESDPSSNSYLLKVTADNTGQVALSTTLRASHGANYQMRDDKFISWNEPTLVTPAGKPTEVALSFADASECRELWHKICQIESTKDSAAPIPPERPDDPPAPPSNASPATATPAASSSLDNPLDDSVLAECITPPQNSSAPLALVDPTSPDAAHSRFLDDHLDGSPVWATPDPIDDVIFQEAPSVLFLPTPNTSLAPNISSGDVIGTAATASSTPPFNMPAPDRTGIEILSKFIANHNASHLPAARTRINAELSSGEYIDRICQLFRSAEDAADYEFLVDLYIVTRFFFAVADNRVIDVLLNDRFVMDVVGCLEYAPERIAAFLRPAVVAESSNDTEAKSNKAAKKDPAPPAKEPSVTEAEQKAPAQSRSREVPSSAEDGANKARSGTPSAAQKAGTMNQPEPLEAQSCQSAEHPSTPLPSSVHVSTESSNANSMDMDHPAGREKTSSEETTTSSGNIDGDAENKASNFRTHRDFLQSKAYYKVVVPIADPIVLGKIHQNFRASYIRDVILRAVGDSPLSSTIMMNNVEIIMYIVSGNVLQDLFESIQVAIRKLLAHRHGVSSGPNQPDGAAHRSSEVSKPSMRVESTQGENQTTTPTPEKAVSTAAEGAENEGHSSSAEGNSNSTNRSEPHDSDEKPISKQPVSHQPESDTIAGQDSGTADPKSSEPCESEAQDLWSMLKFLKELCRIVKGQQANLKNGFHKILLQFGIIEMAVVLLHNGDVSLRSLCSEILWCVVTHDQAEVRTHILKSASHENVFSSPCCAEAKPSVRRRGTVNAGSGSIDPADEDDVQKKDNTGDTDMADAFNISEPGVENGNAARCGNNTNKPGADSSELRKLAEVALHNDDDQHNKLTNGSQSVSNVTNVNSLSVVTGRPVPSSGQPDKDGAPVMPLSGEGRGIRTNFPVLTNMIDIVCKEAESGVAMTMLDVLKSLLDPANMRTQVENSLFLNVFYEKFIVHLLPPIMNFSVSDRAQSSSAPPPSWVSLNAGHIVDLFSFCLKFHTFMCKVFVIQNDVGSKVMRLANHPKPHVQLAAARFLRACVGVREDMMDRYILRMRLLEPIMVLFQKNCNRDNMVTSVVLDLLSFICRENRVALHEHIVWTYRQLLESSPIAKGVLSDFLQKVKVATADPTVLAVTGLVVNGEHVVPQGMGMNMIANLSPGHANAVQESNIHVLLSSPRSNVREGKDESPKPARSIKRFVGAVTLSKLIEQNPVTDSQTLVNLMWRMMNEQGTLQFMRFFEKRRRQSRHSSPQTRKLERTPSSVGGPQPVLKTIGKPKRNRGSSDSNVVCRRLTGLRSKAVDTVVNMTGSNSVEKVSRVEENKALAEGSAGQGDRQRLRVAGSRPGKPKEAGNVLGGNVEQTMRDTAGSSNLNSAGIVSLSTGSGSESSVCENGGRRMRLSLSKSDALRNKGSGAKNGENWDDGQWMSDSSDGEKEEGPLRKRGRGLQPSSVQTSTVSVIGRRKSKELGTVAGEESAPKRPRSNDVEEKESDGKGSVKALSSSPPPSTPGTATNDAKISSSRDKQSESATGEQDSTDKTSAAGTNSGNAVD